LDMAKGLRMPEETCWANEKFEKRLSDLARSFVKKSECELLRLLTLAGFQMLFK